MRASGAPACAYREAKARERADVAEAKRSYAARAGSYEWFRQSKCACPCCCEPVRAQGVHVAGLLRRGGPAQTVWHMLVECTEPQVVEWRHAALGWALKNAAIFNTRQIEYAIAALSGNSHHLDASQRCRALRFMLALPEPPVDCDESGQPQEQAHQALAQGYGRFFCRRMGDILRAGVRARVQAEHGTLLQGRRMETLTRSAWMKRRGLREMWDNRAMSMRCFRSWRALMLMTAGARRADALIARPASLATAIEWWQTRAAFERFASNTGHDLAPGPRILVRDGRAAYAFCTSTDVTTPPGVALAWLRQEVEGAIGRAEAAERRKAAAAASAAAKASRRARREQRKQAKAEAQRAERTQRFSREVRAIERRGRQSFSGAIQKLHRLANRADKAQYTALVIRRIRHLRLARVRRLRAAADARPVEELTAAEMTARASRDGQLAFCQLIRALVANSKRATRAVQDRQRRRRSAEATRRVLNHLRQVHDEHVQRREAAEGWMECFCGQRRHHSTNPLPFAGIWVECGECQRWCHGECAGFVGRTPRADEQYVCPECDPVRAYGTRPAARPRADVRASPQCRAGHTLTRGHVARRLQCDVCQQAIPTGTIAYSCEVCDQDRCTACAGEPRGAATSANQVGTGAASAGEADPAFATRTDSPVAPRCPAGHDLVRTKAALRLTCDMCFAGVPAGSDTFACARCDHDRCAACAANVLHSDGIRPPTRTNDRSMTQGDASAAPGARGAAAGGGGSMGARGGQLVCGKRARCLEAGAGAHPATRPWRACGKRARDEEAGATTATAVTLTGASQAPPLTKCAGV